MGSFARFSFRLLMYACAGYIAAKILLRSWAVVLLDGVKHKEKSY